MDKATEELIGMVGQLLEGQAEIKAMLKGRAAAVSTVGEVAPDSDLDGKYGDPEVRKDPPRWTGASFKGRKFSECPADYLIALAGFCDWKAGKDAEKGTEEGNKYSRYAKIDASRCRGWAKRIEAGWKPAATSPAWEPSDDEAPF